jgi:hypothetical protein
MQAVLASGISPWGRYRPARPDSDLDPLVDFEPRGRRIRANLSAGQEARMCEVFSSDED